MALKLTARQAQILDLIASAVAQTGRPPTRAEIAQAFGFRSANAAEDHLRALERKGFIRLSAGTSRGIQLTNAAMPPVRTASASTGSASPSDLSDIPATLHRGARTILQTLTLPLIGRVAAGHPILAVEHIEREIPLAASLFGTAPDYLLRVRGTSMRDAGILDGDLLAVQHSRDARHGQIVVARLGDEVTVKRLEHLGNHIRLLPENPEFQPIVVGPADDFTIEGIAVGLIRTTAMH